MSTSHLIKEKIKNWKSDFHHSSYYLENKMLAELRMGLADESILTLNQINSLERAVLSKDPIRSLKNSLIASCTLFTRAVIESGVNGEDAYAMSDVFINHIESLEQMQPLREFEYEMLREFIDMVHKKVHIQSTYHVSQIIKYISSNITERITLEALSKYTSKSPDYLSRLFKKELGINVTHYVLRQKIESAKYYLDYTTMNITDVAAMLGFSNSAHFTKVFKQYTGMTPSAYQRQRAYLL